MQGEAPSVPPQVDGYRVEGVLGRGGSAIVLRVFDANLDRPLALKLLSDEHDPDSRARFRIEAQAAARIVHPNVVQVYGAGEHDGRPYILQELVEGLAVSKVLAARGRLPSAAVAEIGLQAAEGLAAAAKVGVLHRDVKPHNLLIADGGDVKLADFGVAKLLNAPSGLTQDGTTLGTPHYMSPEQGQGAPMDHRSDQYALGATLYHLLAGAPPFDDEHAVALLLKHAQAELPPLLEAAPDCPTGLAAAIERMLSKDPEARFEDFDAVAEALSALADPGGPEQMKALAATPIDARSAPATGGTTSWRQGLSVGLVALGAVGVLAVAQLAAPKAPTMTGRTAPPAPAVTAVPAPIPAAAVAARDPFTKPLDAPVDRRRPLRARSTRALIRDLGRAPKRQIAAAEELGRRSDQAATFALLDALRTARRRAVADAAASALADLGDIRALQPLKTIAEEGRTDDVRQAALRAHRSLYRVEE